MATKLMNYYTPTKDIRAVVNNKVWMTNVTTKVMPSGTTTLTAAEKTELTTELTYFEKALTSQVKYLNPDVGSRPVL